MFVVCKYINIFAIWSHCCISTFHYFIFFLYYFLASVNRRVHSELTDSQCQTPACPRHPCSLGRLNTLALSGSFSRFRFLHADAALTWGGVSPRIYSLPLLKFRSFLWPLHRKTTLLHLIMGFGDLKSISGLKLLNDFLSDRSYIEGWVEHSRGRRLTRR